MEKDQKSTYYIEREFLSKISTQELILRIIKAHIAKDKEQHE